MPSWTELPATSETDWTATAFVQQFFINLNAIKKSRGIQTGKIPALGAAFMTRGYNPGPGDIDPALTITAANFSAAGSTVTLTKTHGMQVGDVVCLTNVAQANMDGLQTITAVSGTASFSWEVSGSPTIPPTKIDASKIFGCYRVSKRATDSVDHIWIPFYDLQFDAESSALYSFNHASQSAMRTAAGISTSGYRRMKPRETTGSGTTDTNGNTVSAGHKAIGPVGRIFRYVGAGVWENAGASKSVTSITRSGTKATVTVTAHGYTKGSVVAIAGASQSAYNGDKIITVIDANTFTFEVAGSPATPATGTITASERIPGPPDLLDSTLAAPFNMPYGPIQTGDYIAAHLFNELRQVIDVL